MTRALASPDEALEWLYNTQPLGVKLGLENMQRLMRVRQLGGAPQRYVHVAGTNGKGSTCAFIHALLSVGAGRRTGLFTSPHLIHFAERIRDERREINGAELLEGLNELREEVLGWEALPTFFELTLALGLWWFRERGLEWVVLETGLGGRLDATNAVLPEVCVITRIGLDHTQFLGETLQAIAREKAGIIKVGVPVVTGPQEPEAMAVLREVAAERGARLIEVTEPFTTSALGLAGEHQQWNAALALAAVQVLGLELEPSAKSQALEHTRWPGRFERVEPELVLDGAHNADSIAALVSTWRQVFGERRAALVFGAVQDKQVDVMLGLLAPVVAHWYLTGFQSPRALGPEAVQQRLLALGLAEAGEMSCHAGVTEALATARAAGHPVVVCGSLFLVGETLALLRPEAAAFQSSWQ
jgi:dihydrofolate synthase / folylpolyglutamate synthase